VEQISNIVTVYHGNGCKIVRKDHTTTTRTRRYLEQQQQQQQQRTDQTNITTTKTTANATTTSRNATLITGAANTTTMATTTATYTTNNNTTNGTAATGGYQTTQQQQKQQQQQRLPSVIHFVEENGGSKSSSYYAHNYEFFHDFKYCIVMENRKVDGYISEKILNGFLAGCLPIYYGTAEVFDIFNADAFVYYDIDRPHVALDRLRYLENNFTAYLQMLHVPILKNGTQTINDYFSIYPNIGNGQLNHRIRTTMMGLPSLQK
jgi:hypothetical protein